MARTSGSRSIAAVIAALALGVACSPKGGSAPLFRVEGPASDNAFVRFLDGSPDASGGGSIAVVAKSGQFVASVPYAQISTFVGFTRNIAAEFTVTSAAWPTALTCATPYALVPGAYYTVVVAGSVNGVGNQRLQCQVFAENFITPSTTQFQLLVHHASPSTYLAGQPTLQVGTFMPANGSGPTTSTVAGAVAFTTIFAGSSPSSAQTSVSAQLSSFQVGGSGAGGIGIFVNPGPGSVTPAPTPTPSPTPTPTPAPPGPTPTPSPTPVPTPTPSPEATFLPANAVIGAGNPGSLPDPTNAFPVALTTTLSIYIIDAPIGTFPPGPPFRLVGVFD